MPYKIAVSVTNDLNQDQRMHRICNSLTSAGYEVMLIGRKKRFSQELLHHKFNQKRIKCWFGSGMLFYFEYNIRLFLFLIMYKADIIYSVDLDTLTSGGMVAILTKKKLIYDAHEYFVEVPELENSNFKKWIWNIVAKCFIPKSDLNITVNKELAEVLKKKYKHDFAVIRSVPLLVKSEKLRSTNKEKVILYQGVLNKGRGLEEAIKWISNKKEKIQLRIVGEGDLSESLRELKAKIDKNDKVKFLGWKTPKELDEITKSAWLGLNLLDGKSLNYKYSLANKFFNYMHAGVPSLNMDFPVYKRYCKDENVGICIPDLGEGTIDKAINSILKDDTKYQEMALAAQVARTKHSWQLEEVKLIDIIKKMMEA